MVGCSGPCGSGFKTEVMCVQAAWDAVSNKAKRNVLKCTAECDAQHNSKNQNVNTHKISKNHGEETPMKFCLMPKSLLACGVPSFGCSTGCLLVHTLPLIPLDCIHTLAAA